MEIFLVLSWPALYNLETPHSKTKYKRFLTVLKTPYTITMGTPPQNELPLLTQKKKKKKKNSNNNKAWNKMNQPFSILKDP